MIIERGVTADGDRVASHLRSETGEQAFDYSLAAEDTRRGADALDVLANMCTPAPLRAPRDG